MDSPETRVQILQQESERLQQYIKTLAPEAWSQPTQCGQWQVRDVVSHLAGGAAVYTMLVSRGLKGDSSTPEGFAPAGVGDAASGSDFIAERAIANREKLGDQLLSTFVAQDGEFNRLLAGLSPEDWDKPCYHFVGVCPVRTFTDYRITELAMHGWDIRSKFETSAHLSPETLQVFADLIPESLQWTFRKGTGLPTPVRYRFAVTGVVLDKSDVVVEGEECRMEPATTTAAAATLRCDADTYALLMFGRLSLGTAKASGRVLVEGDSRLAAQFDQWFQGV